MRYDRRFPVGGSLASSFFPTGVKWLLIINIALFVVYFLVVNTGISSLAYVFSGPLGLALRPAAVLQFLALWQVVTYMFLHDPTGFSHILFNMFSLWMFGADLERAWGTRRFLKFYFVCGVGAGLCVIAGSILFGGMHAPTIGASGAIYGLLMAFGILYPDRVILFSFLFPIKAKYFVLIIGAITFLSTLGSTGSGVSHIAHLGGLIFGYFYLKGLRTGRRFQLGFAIQDRYRQWKIDRAKKKFQVYMRKNDPDRWVH